MQGVAAHDLIEHEEQYLPHGEARACEWRPAGLWREAEHAHTPARLSGLWPSLQACCLHRAPHVHCLSVCSPLPDPQAALVGSPPRTRLAAKPRKPEPHLPSLTGAPACAAAANIASAAAI